MKLLAQLLVSWLSKAESHAAAAAVTSLLTISDLFIQGALPVGCRNVSYDRDMFVVTINQ